MKIPFRVNDERWRHDSVYIHILNSSGYLIFHGAFPKRELQNRRDILRDEVTGELVISQIIQAALARESLNKPESSAIRLLLPLSLLGFPKALRVSRGLVQKFPNLDGRRPDSDFVRYHYDNLADDGDSADVPKLTYALARRIGGKDGRTEDVGAAVVAGCNAPPVFQSGKKILDFTTLAIKFLAVMH